MCSSRRDFRVCSCLKPGCRWKRRAQTLGCLGCWCTLPETNSSPLKMDGWNTTFLLGRPIFRGYVSFRECKPVRFNNVEVSFLKWNWIVHWCGCTVDIHTLHCTVQLYRGSIIHNLAEGTWTYNRPYLMDSTRPKSVFTCCSGHGCGTQGISLWIIHWGVHIYIYICIFEEVWESYSTSVTCSVSTLVKPFPSLFLRRYTPKSRFRLSSQYTPSASTGIGTDTSKSTFGQ